MKYSINSNVYLNRKEKVRVGAKWFLYLLTLTVTYMIMTGGVFDSWQPLSVIPLALAAAMHQNELSACVFAVLCGFVMDIATGSVFGFTPLFLLPAAMMASVLVYNYIKSNLVNHLWITAATCIVMGSIEYLFEYRIWDYKGYDIILKQYLLPSYISTLAVAPVYFLLISWICASFTNKETGIDDDSLEEKEEEE